MIIYDHRRGEVINASTGLVVEQHAIDPGPEWRSYRPGARRCHVMYRGEPGALKFFKSLSPGHVYEDARYIMEKLGLGGRAGALAAIMYSCKRFGVPFDNELFRLGGVGRSRVYRVYRRLLEELGSPPRIDDAVLSQVVSVAVRLGRPWLASMAATIYRRLREKYQGYRPAILAAVALVKSGLLAKEASKLLGVPLSTLSKALKNIGG